MKEFSQFDLRSILYLSLFWLYWFITFTSRTLLAPIAPILEDEFHISHTATGGLFAAISIGNGMALFFMGIFSNSLGHKRTIILSFIFNSILFFLLSLNRFFPLFYPLFFVLGFAAGAYLPSALALLTKIYSERLWGFVIPIHDSAASASIFLAPFIAYWLLKCTTWKGIFLIMGLSFLLLSISFPRVSKNVEETDLGGGSTRRIFFEIVKNKTLWVISIILTISAGANMGLYYVLPLYLSKEIGLEIPFAQKALGFSRIGAFFFVFVVAFLLDFFDIKKLLFSILFSSGILTFAIPFFPIDYGVYVLFFQATVISAMFPLSFVVISKIVSPKKRAFATGFTVSIASIVGIGLVPYVLGFFGDHFSFALGIKMLGVVTLMTSFLVFRIN